MNEIICPNCKKAFKIDEAGFADIVKQIRDHEFEEELHKPIEDLFSDFSEQPIASASISQVYRAKLKDGTIVAVKVQRPNVKKIMDTDIEIMFYIAKLIEKHSEKIKKYRPVKIVEEFKEWTDKELDFE